MTKRPAMLFYPGDWLKDPAVRCLSLTSRAIWFDLLCFMFEAEERGSITATPKELARLVGATASQFRTFLIEARKTRLCDFDQQGVTEPHAQPNGNLTLTNRRMVRDEKARLDNADRQRRFYDRHKPNADLTADLTEASQTSSSSSSISSSKKEKREPLTDARFAEFWERFPKKTAKQDAQRAWVKLRPDPALADLIIADVGKRWIGYEKTYIPQASKYLKGRRWEDEIISPLTNGSRPAPLPRLPTPAEVEAARAARRGI
jgi:hypothetical protein